MKTPHFWQSRGFLSTLLLPLAVLYGAVSGWRYRRVSPLRMPLPVICIGNVTAGGAGKTPLALWAGEQLKKQSIRAFYLSRGYGGNLHGPLRVDPAVHGAKEVGDEPLLLARVLPTVVARDRIAGAMLAQAQGAQVIVMDDGFQNPFLHKTLSLLVVDGGYGVGNGRLLPAGPLRERWESALSRTQAVVVINPDTALPEAAGLPVYTAHTDVVPPLIPLHARKVLAFCGLGRPEKFFATLRALGAELIESVAYGDHHPYTEAELSALVARARTAGALLATTAKDAVRLPAGFVDKVVVVEIRLVMDAPAALAGLLATLLDGALHE